MAVRSSSSSSSSDTEGSGLAHPHNRLVEAAATPVAGLAAYQHADEYGTLTHPHHHRPAHFSAAPPHSPHLRHHRHHHHRHLHHHLRHHHPLLAHHRHSTPPAPSDGLYPQRHLHHHHHHGLHPIGLSEKHHLHHLMDLSKEQSVDHALPSPAPEQAPAASGLQALAPHHELGFCGHWGMMQMMGERSAGAHASPLPAAHGHHRHHRRHPCRSPPSPPPRHRHPGHGAYWSPASQPTPLAHGHGAMGSADLHPLPNQPPAVLAA